MFKSRVTTLIMLASVMCFSVLSVVAEYTQGRGYVWIYPTVLGIVGLIVVLYVRVKKNRKRIEEKAN